MSTVLRLTKNSVALLIASLVERLAGIVFIAVLVRLVSREDFGAYSLVLTFFEFAVLLADLGMSQLLVITIAPRRSDAGLVWSSALFLGGMWSLLAWLGLGVVAVLANYSQPVPHLLRLVGAALLFKVMWLFAGAVLRAFERMEIVAAVNCIYTVLFVTVGLACLHAGGGIESAIWILVLLTALIGLLSSLVVHRWFVPFRWKVDFSLCVRMLRGVWPIALLLACDVVLRRAGLLVLSFVQPLSAVATYSAALKLVDWLSLLTASLTGALLPHLALQWRNGMQPAWRTYRSSLRLFILVSVGLTAGTLVLARPLVILLLGAPYLDSIAPLRILVLSFFLNFVGGPMGALLLVSETQLRAFVPRALAVTLASVGLLIWLLPRYGYTAAAWVAVASAAAFLAFKVSLVQRLAGERIPWAAFLIRPLIAALSMALALYPAASRGGWLLWTVPLGVVCYGLFLLVSGEFRALEYEPLCRSWRSILLRVRKLGD